MLEKENKEIGILRQCHMLSLSPSVLYYKNKPENEENLTLMKRIDELCLKYPYYGARRVQQRLMKEQQRKINIKRVRRLMHKMGIIPIYPKKSTTKPNILHKKYPYLLRNLEITRPNQVWSTDITYIPMKRGFMYLTAIMDWHSRKVLSWKLSNTMTVESCRECLQNAIDHFGRPEIFNSDQGCQFTSVRFTSIWDGTDTKISMDGKGRATDNAFIERLWRSVKYENIYPNAYQNGSDLFAGLFEYFHEYNTERQHQSLSYQTPDEVYFMNKLTDINKEKRSKKEISSLTTNDLTLSNLNSGETVFENGVHYR